MINNYNITGMSCAACQARIEKAVSKLETVDSVSVSLLTNSMRVEGTAAPEEIIKTVEGAGYGAALKTGSNRNIKEKEGHISGNSAENEELEDRESPVILKRILLSAGFLAVLMYFSMGHMMLGLPLPGWFDGNHVAMGLVQLLLAAVVMIINNRFFIGGFRGLVHCAPNMDTLVALGSAASFVYSVWMLFLMSDAVIRGGADAGMKYMDELYFESAAMILVLISVGKFLEARSKGKTTDALRALIGLTPRIAHVIRNEEELVIPAEELEPGDIFIVRPGESIPADGTVLWGSSAVNEAALTGESIPVDKTEGDSVSAATINQSGTLKCRADNVGDDTLLAGIIRLVSDAAATKAPIARVADKVSGVFVPIVIAISIVTFAVWKLTGAEVGFALARAVSVLVISCPCALGLATPVAIMVGSGKGARSGILFKTAEALELTGRLKTVVLDKTGTVTTGRPEVTDVLPNEGTDRESFLRLACSAEALSSHPLALAVREYGERNHIELLPAENFETMVGSGIRAVIEGTEVCVGNLRLAKSLITQDDKLEKLIEELAEDGKTPLIFVGKSGEMWKTLGVIAVADAVRSEASAAVAELKKMGIRVVMLTGDNRKTAEAVGRIAGIDEIIAEVLPGDKEAAVRELQKYGRTAMVGDGINDAPALTAADVGMAVGGGTDIAADAADAVLMNGSLISAVNAVKLGRAVLRCIHQNLFWAFIYNIIGIPLAAGVYIGITGWTLSPMFAAAAMSMSSFCVVTNALRLNIISMKKVSVTKDNTYEMNNTEKEKNTMKKEMKIEGMMCMHCEAAVKKALEAVEGVSSAQVSHEKGTAVVELAAEVQNSDLVKAVEDKEYKVLSVK